MADLGGTSGPDYIKGTDGDDTINAGSGSDTVAGLNGNDTINGGTQPDLLRGMGGDDTISGGAGGDTIMGGTGADEMTGGSGSDTFVFRMGADFRSATDDDVITDFTLGTDQVSLSGHANFGLDVEEVDGDLVLWVVTMSSGKDKGSITFEGLGDAVDLFQGTEGLTLADVEAVLNAAPIEEILVPLVELA